MPVYEINTYVLLYDSLTKNVSYNEHLNLPTLTESGKTFLGWFYLDSNDNEQKAPTKMPDANLEVYSKWEDIVYKVDFNVDGLLHESYLVLYNEVVTPSVPSKTNFEFVGWYTEEAYTNEFDFDSVVTSSITLHAKWQQLTFNITYNIDSNTTNPNDKQTFNINDQLELKPAVKIGYIFVKWLNQDNDEIITLKEQQANQVLIPQFIKETYSITYTSNMTDFTHLNTDKTTYQIDDNYTFKPALTNGYEFIGWYYNDELITSLNNLNGSITLEAGFEANSHTITYFTGDSNIDHLNETSYQFGQNYTFTSPEQKAGYTFSGWHLGHENGTLSLETLTCPSCLQKINNAVKGLDGVDKESVNVMFNSSKVKVDFDEAKISVDDIAKAIDKLGYEVKKTQVK